MAENVPVSGFSVPGIPAGPQAVPPAAAQVPGFVAPAPAPTPGTFTQADLDAALAADRATRTPAAPAPVAAPLAPGAGINAPTDLTTATDPVLTSMTSVFMASGAGVDMGRALGRAIASGNVADIDLAYLAEKGGVNANHLTVLAKAIVERVNSQAQAGEAAVYQAAGSKEQWAAAAALYDQGAPAHQKLVVKTMLDSGDQATIAAAAQAVMDFAKASGKLVQVPGLVAAGAAQMSSAQALDKISFQAELRKLNPNSRSFAQDRATLFNRRQLGKSLGQ